MGQSQFSVSGNLDQIQKHGGFNDYEFEAVDPSIPNRVTTYFDNRHDAVNLYFAMEIMGMVALKNWI